MTQEEKQLLIKDLCARLPYGLKISIKDDYLQKMVNDVLCAYHIGGISYNLESRNLKPYLRPMSSMTEKERKEFHHYASVERNYLGDDKFYTHYQMIDWLNSHHFDYRGLIEKGLAIEAKEGMYKTE